jgi:hypothetical protein
MNLKNFVYKQNIGFVTDWVKLPKYEEIIQYRKDEEMIQSKNRKTKPISNNLFIFKTFIILLILSGCTSTPHKISVSEGVRPTLVNYNPPEWVMKGPGIFKDPTGKIIWGVSSVSGVKNASLQRIAADNRARNAVAKVFQVHSKSLSKDMLAHAMTGNLESTSEEQGIETGIKTVVEQILHGVMIVDHWEHPGRNELFSLARLDLNQFENISKKLIDGKDYDQSKDNTNKALEEYSNQTSKFPEDIKESIKNSSDKFFQEFN